MGRNKDELIKLAEKITGQECKDVLTKKDALKKIACYYLGEEKEFASIADCLESIVEHGATGGSGGGGDTLYCWKMSSDTYPSGTYIYTNYDKTPDASAFLLSKRINKIGESAVTQKDYSTIEVFNEKTNDTMFTTSFGGPTATYERYLSGDFTDWS